MAWRQESVSVRVALVSGATIPWWSETSAGALTTHSLALTLRARNWPASGFCCIGSRSSPGLWGETPGVVGPLLGLYAPARGGSDLHTPKYEPPHLRDRPRRTTTPRAWSIC